MECGIVATPTPRQHQAKMFRNVTLRMSLPQAQPPSRWSARRRGQAGAGAVYSGLDLSFLNHSNNLLDLVFFFYYHY